MKKFLLILILFALAIGAVFSQEVNLKEAITRSARGVEGELPQRAKVIVLNFESPAKAFSDYVIDELSGELIEGKKITVVDRKNIATIMDEMKFQYSGYVSDESMVSIGKMLGAQAIISGSLTDIGANYRFRIKIINVETAAVQKQISLDLKKDSQVAYLLGGAVAQKEIQQEAERQKREIEREQQRIEKTKPTSNVRDNWVSGEFSYALSTGGLGVSIGGSYERMINSKSSIGTNLYVVILGGEPEIFGSVMKKDTVKDDLDWGFNFGIEAFSRWYLWSRKFFLSAAAGYYNVGKAIDIYEYSYGKYTSSGYAVAQGSGFGIGTGMGWKIDPGKEGGFFWNGGISSTVILGKIDYSNAPKDQTGKTVESNTLFTAFVLFRTYLGAGWAF